MSDTPQPQKTLRQIYREERQRRQTTVFSTLIAVMAALVVLSLLVLTGLLPMPFSEFSHDKEYAEVGDVPCPTVDAGPVDAKQVRLQVLNATDRPGLAGQVGEAMTEAGYTVVLTDNYTVPFRGGVEIDAGPSGVDAAYTVARFFEDVRMRLTAETTNTVTIIIGDSFGDSPTADKIAEVKGAVAKLVPIENCKEVAPPSEGDTESGQSADSAESAEG